MCCSLLQSPQWPGWARLEPAALGLPWAGGALVPAPQLQQERRSQDGDQAPHWK